MLTKLNDLLITNKISQEQYQLFVLFAPSAGAEFLKNKLMAAAMEDSPTVTDPGFSWADGRRSVWRDIQNTLNFIYQLLEENNGSE